MNNSLHKLFRLVIGILKGKPGVTLYTNTIYIWLATAITALFGFVFWIVAARYYTPSEVGLASALLSAAGLITALANLGLGMGLIRFLPQEVDKKSLINSCFTIGAIGSLVGAAIFIAGLNIWSPPLLFIRHNAVALFSFFILASLGCLLQLQSSVFLGLRSAQFRTLQQTLAATLRIPLIIILVSLAALGIVYSWAIAWVITFIVANLLLIKIQPGYRPKPVIKKWVVKKIIPFSFGNYIADIVGSLPVSILPLMVIGLLGAEPNAYFRIGYSMASILFMVPYAVCSSLYIEGSYEPEKLRHNITRSISLILLIVIPAIAVIFFFGDKILLLFGSDYSQNAFQLLWILSFATIPLAINEIYAVVKRVKLEIKPMVYLFLCITALTLGLSYILMTRIGLVGIAIGWLAGQSIPALFTGSRLISEFIKKFQT